MGFIPRLYVIIGDERSPEPDEPDCASDRPYPTPAVRYPLETDAGGISCGNAPFSTAPEPRITSVSTLLPTRNAIRVDEVVTVRADRLALPLLRCRQNHDASGTPLGKQCAQCRPHLALPLQIGQTSNELNSSMTSTIHGNSRDGLNDRMPRH